MFNPDYQKEYFHWSFSCSHYPNIIAIIWIYKVQFNVLSLTSTCPNYNFKTKYLQFFLHPLNCMWLITWRKHIIQTVTYGNWIYNYLCNQCLSPLKLWHRIPSVLLVEEIEVPGENHGPVAGYWQTLSNYVASSKHRHERGSNSQL